MRIHFALSEAHRRYRTITIIPKQFAKRWFLPESSVYEAIGKLKANNTININSGRFTIEWVNSQQEQDSENSEKFWEPRKNYGIPEKILESQKKLRNPRKNSGISENSPPKSAPDKDYSTPQTIQTPNKLYSNSLRWNNKPLCTIGCRGLFLYNDSILSKKQDGSTI